MNEQPPVKMKFPESRCGQGCFSATWKRELLPDSRVQNPFAKVLSIQQLRTRSIAIQEKELSLNLRNTCFTIAWRFFALPSPKKVSVQLDPSEKKIPTRKTFQPWVWGRSILQPSNQPSGKNQTTRCRGTFTATLPSFLFL